MGSGIKTPTISEQFTRKSLQKCIVAAREIKKGMIFTEEDLITKRTGGEGISAYYYDSILGRKSDRDYQENDIIMRGSDIS